MKRGWGILLSVIVLGIGIGAMAKYPAATRGVYYNGMVHYECLSHPHGKIADRQIADAMNA